MDLEYFKKNLDQFQLGDLNTESINPLSMGLSHFAQVDVKKALAIISEIDLTAMRVLSNHLDQIEELHLLAKKVWSNGGRVFLCGCGATGRLSIVLETLKRMGENYLAEPIISFMAGGDVALIKSLESFEDREDYGVRQLKELGFNHNDLLIGVTEGGETSFVIGATLEASQISDHHPYFIFCNPPDLLAKKIERSRKVIHNDKIKKIPLLIGAMALSGSTRMQASSVQMSFLALALLNWPGSVKKSYFELMQVLDYDYTHLAEFTMSEAGLYQQNQYLLYKAPPSLAVSVLTDTTERSPTFSLNSFENIQDDNAELAWAYLQLESAQSAQEAWELLLARKVRGLDWAELNGVASEKRLLGFDISYQAHCRRSKKAYQHEFIIDYNGEELLLDFNQNTLVIDVRDRHLFSVHLLLKVLLNAHSTVLMGRLDRFRSNVMTWVKASNYKLLDRATRYTLQLLKEQSKEVHYLDVASYIFNQSKNIKSDRSVVMEAFAHFSS